MKIAFAAAVLLMGSLWAEEPSLKTGKDVKKKLVIETPFGPSVKEAEPPATESRPKPAGTPLLTIEEKGDVITFRRQTPFGESVWKRKRSELSEVEKQLVSAQKQASK